MSIEAITSLILFGMFFLFLFSGLPIAFGIIISSFFAVFFILSADYADYDATGFGILNSEGFSGALNALGQGLATGVDSFALLAIPLFVIAGSIMNSGGIAKRLINLTKVAVAPLPGSLAHINIIANTLFGALAGIATAAAIAVGGTIFPHAMKEKYDRGFMASVNAASAPSGLIIPPSGSLILYSLYSGGTSIAALFVAGYIPGILWGVSCFVPALIYTVKNKYPRDSYPPFKEMMKYFIDGIMPLILIFLIVGGIIFGYYTATEAAGMAVFFSIVMSLLYREIRIRDIPRVFLDAVIPTSIATFLVAASGVMGWVLSYAQIPSLITEFIINLSSNTFVILLALNAMLLIIGTFLDLTPALIIFTPILFPISQMLGIDPVHFGVIMVFNLSIGLITPPVGTLLFVSCSIANIPFQKIIRHIIPMVLLLIVALLGITYIPAISLFLPKLFGLI